MSKSIHERLRGMRRALSAARSPATLVALFATVIMFASAGRAHALTCNAGETLFSQRIATNTDDGEIRAQNSAYASTTSGSINIVRDNGAVGAAESANDGAAFTRWESFTRWDTSSIPDTATITAATVTVNVVTWTNTDSWSIDLCYFDWGSTVDSSDWTDSTCNTASTRTLASIGGTGSKVFTLSNLSNISKTAYTGIRWMTDHVPPSSPPGVGNDRIYWNAKDNGTGDSPLLEVCYSGGGLRAQYHLNESSGTSASDSSGYGNTASETSTGTSCSWVSGKLSNGLSCVGAKYYSAPDSASLNPTANVSLTFWFKHASQPSTGWVTKGTVGSNTYDYMGYFAAGYPCFYVKNTGNTGVSACGGAMASNNAWHLFTGTYDGANIRVYLDGVLAGGPTAQTGAIKDSTDPFVFTGGWDGPKAGSVDEICVFDSPLSYGDVKALWNGGSGATCDTLASSPPALLTLTTNVPFNATQYDFTGATSNTTENNYSVDMATSGRMVKMYIACEGAPNQNATFTMMKNGSATSVACTVSSGTKTCEYTTTGSVGDYAAGDNLSVKIVTTNTSFSAVCRADLTVAANGSDSAAHDQVIAWNSGGGGFSPIGSTSYCGPSSSGTYAANCNNTTASAAAWIMPKACTLSALSVKASSTLSATVTWAFTVRRVSGSVSNADTDLNVSLTSSTAEARDTTCTSNCSVAAGDTIAVKLAETNTGTTRNLGFDIECSGAGGWVGAISDGYWTRGATRYYNAYAAENSSVSQVVRRAPRDVRLQNLYVKMDATGGDNIVTVCTGSTNSPTCDTSRPHCTVTTGNTTCSDTSTTIDIAAGDYYAVKIDSTADSGSGAGTFAFEMVDVPRATPTPTPTNTGGANTSTPTSTPTNTPTSTPTITPNAAPSQAAVFTNTPTPTPTRTVTPNSAPSQVAVFTSTNTPVPTATNTPVNTATNTPVNTNTPTVTPNPAPSQVAGFTPTNTAVFTPTNTPVNTATNTPVNTVTNTPVNTATNTPTPTVTPNPAPSQGAVFTNTPTNTPVWTSTNTPINTATPTNTLVPTATNTPQNTGTPTETPINTATPSATFSSTITNTPVDTLTPAETPTPTPTLVEPAYSIRLGSWLVHKPMTPGLCLRPITDKLAAWVPCD